MTESVKRKNGIFVPLVGGGGLSVAALLWWLLQSQLTPLQTHMADMEPRLRSVEREQAVLGAQVLARLDAIDQRLRRIEQRPE